MLPILVDFPVLPSLEGFRAISESAVVLTGADDILWSRMSQLR